MRRLSAAYRVVPVSLLDGGVWILGFPPQRMVGGKGVRKVTKLRTPEWETPEMLKAINQELAEQLSQAEAAADPEVLAYLRKLEAEVKWLRPIEAEVRYILEKAKEPVFWLSPDEIHEHLRAILKPLPKGEQHGADKKS